MIREPNVVEYPLPRKRGRVLTYPNPIGTMTLRKHGAETFPDDIETTLEIAMMGEELSDRFADSVE